MKLSFTKMHGCGNNYIYINCFEQKVTNPEKLSVALSEPHFGIGGDGIILISPSDRADAQMRIFNADGSEGKMCGNGIRCVGKYLYDNGIVPRDDLTIEAGGTVHRLHLYTRFGTVGLVTVDMGKPAFEPANVPVMLEGERVIDRPVTIAGGEYRITCLSMGNPHCVIFFNEDDVDDLDLSRLGPKFEHHPLFPERINTEFVNVLPDGSLKMRVWERGSGETWACGTGACATGVAACLNGFAKPDTDITVHLRGGDLTIRYTTETVFMTGAATTVFKGEIEL